MGEETGEGRSAKVGGSSARIGREVVSHEDFIMQTGGLVSSASILGLRGKLGICLVPGGRPPPAPTQLPLPHPPPLGRIQRCALPPGPRNVLFCTTPDAAPAGTSCHRWQRRASGARKHPQRLASMNERMPNAKTRVAPEKVKKCAGVIYSKGNQLNLVSRPASFPDPVPPQNCPDTHRGRP